MNEEMELPLVDTSIQDWASDYLGNANETSKLILPASVTSKKLAEYISSLGNLNGGYILVGAYSEIGYGSGFQSVDPELILDAKNRIEGIVPIVEEHSPRYQKIYLLKINKSDSMVFADGSPYVLKNGKPVLMSEKALIKKLGLGIDSSLINMISEQITKQSAKVDAQSEVISKLTEELKEKSKLKNQIPGLLTGALVGALLGWLLPIPLNHLFGIS